MGDMARSLSTAHRLSSALWAIAAIATMVALATLVSAQTQEYPNRPIQLLVGLPAGGGADVVARAIAASLTERVGQQGVVDNRTGSGGLIAATGAAHAAPDGYTLLFGTVSYSAIFASLYKKLPYD